MTDRQEPLQIGGWQSGIADSPHLGIGLIRNADIDSYPGAVKVGKQPTELFHKIRELTFTADPNTDICLANGTIEENNKSIRGAAVYFTTTGTLPAGLSPNTTYYLIEQPESNRFKVATSYKNSAGSTPGTNINITNAGTGIHTIHQLPIGIVNWIINDWRTNTKYLLSSNGRVWFAFSNRAFLLNNSAIDTPTSGVANSSGNGIALSSFSSSSNTWLFVFRNGNIDVINVFGTSEIEALNWNNAWKSMNTGAGVNNSHHAIKAQDDAIYFCDADNVGSIIENVGQSFDPTNGATFTYNNSALQLLSREVAQCLEELGINLLIGGNIFNFIYPWDRSSISFGLPIDVPENQIKRMKNIGGEVYILAGTMGNIYKTQGSYVTHVATIPQHVINKDYSITESPVTWGGIAMAKGQIIFGVEGVTAGSSGVYRLYQDGRLIHDNTPPSGSKNVIGLWARDNFYLMGYNGGASIFSSTQYSTGLPTVLQSQLFKVATKTGKGKFSELEVRTATPATSGQMKISYRRDRTSAFAELATFNADSSSDSFKSDIGINDIENIQIQVEMHGNFELVDVILHP